MHLAVKKVMSFINWAEKGQLNVKCVEVQALQFIGDHQIVAEKIVELVLWGLVYGLMEGQHPIPTKLSDSKHSVRTGSHPREPCSPSKWKAKRICVSELGMPGSTWAPGLSTGSMPSRKHDDLAFSMVVMLAL